MSFLASEYELEFKNISLLYDSNVYKFPFIKYNHIKILFVRMLITKVRFHKRTLHGLRLQVKFLSKAKSVVLDLADFTKQQSLNFD